MKTLILLMIAVLVNFMGCDKKTSDDNSTNQNGNFPGRGNQGNDGGGFYVTPTLPSGTATGTFSASISGFNISCSSASAAQNIMQLSLDTTKKSDGNDYKSEMYFNSECVNNATITISSMAVGDVATLTVTIKSLEGSEVLLTGTTAAYTQASPSPVPSPSPGAFGSFQRPAPVEVPINMTAPAATTLAFSVDLYEMANACGSVVIETQDSSGDNATPASQITVDLSTTNTSTGNFYSDNGCSKSITSAVIPTSGYSVTVYYKDSTGTPTLKADDAAGSSGLTEASESAVIENPSSLAFTGSALSQSTSTCGALDVEVQDAKGNPIKLNAAKTVTLTTSSGGGHFYTDSVCSTTPITSVSIPAYASDLTIYYKDAATGSTTTLTAAPNSWGITITNATMPGVTITQ